MLHAAAVFAAMFTLDFVWARYTVATTAHRALAASVYASLILLLNGIATLSFVADPLLIAPAALGAFAGTFAAVRLAKP